VSQQINLFNPIFLKQKKIFGAVPMLQALGVIVLGVLAMSWFAQQRVGELRQRAASGQALVAGREARLNKATADFAPRQRSAALQVEVTAAEAQLSSLHQVEAVLHGGALGNTAGYAEYFRAFARQNVNGLWLTGLSIVGAGNDIGVQGRAMQATLIPDYIARLTAEKIMSGKTFGSLQIDRPTLDNAAAPASTPAAAAPPSAASLPAAATAQTAPGAAPAAAPAAPSARLATLAPFVQFRLQSQAVEAAK
jgi:hypothetical protein